MTTRQIIEIKNQIAELSNDYLSYSYDDVHMIFRNLVVNHGENYTEDDIAEEVEFFYNSF